MLLHEPLVTQAIPEKLVPQSELICRRLYCVFVVSPAAFNGPCLLSDIVAFWLTGFAVHSSTLAADQPLSVSFAATE